MRWEAERSSAATRITQTANSHLSCSLGQPPRSLAQDATFTQRSQNYQSGKLELWQRKLCPAKQGTYVVPCKLKNQHKTNPLGKGACH